MSVDEGCSSFSVLGQFVCVYLMMCDGIFILTGDNKVLECKWDSVPCGYEPCIYEPRDYEPRDYKPRGYKPRGYGDRL